MKRKMLWFLYPAFDRFWQWGDRRLENMKEWWRKIWTRWDEAMWK